MSKPKFCSMIFRDFYFVCVGDSKCYTFSFVKKKISYWMQISLLTSKGMSAFNCSISPIFIMNLVCLKESPTCMDDMCMDDVRIKKTYSYSIPVRRQTQKLSWLDSEADFDQCCDRHSGKMSGAPGAQLFNRYALNTG